MMMKKLSYSQMLKQLAPENLRDLPEVGVSVLRNTTLEAIEPYLKYNCYLDGRRLNCRFGEYDNIYQEAVGGDDRLFSAEVQCIFLVSGIDNLSVDLSRRFPCLTELEVQKETERVCGYIDDVLAGIRRQTGAMILWAGFELPVYPATGILDAQQENSQSSVIADLNNYVRSRLRKMDAAYYLDTNMILSRVGADRFYDYRYWHIGKAPYSRVALQEMAAEVVKYLRPIMGKTRKCLVLDCDNTLWGGVIGEDGLSSIALGSTYPGSPYYEFQQEIVNLFHRGVLIALCSKNNPEDVWEVFDRHPDMVLKREHIVTSQINWDDKATNLKKIAADLNIGLESLVYIDDSEFEINLVKSALPDVTVLHAHGDHSVEFRTMLVSCGFFDVLSSTGEDAKRGEMYQADAERRKLKGSSVDVGGYLESLDMVLEIGPATDFSIPRIAQLTQKTNQFNLTTRRYTEADVRIMAEDTNTEVLKAELEDRFGGMGIIGICIVRYQGDTARIDSFMLSCRALGRGVEYAFLKEVITRAGSRSVTRLVGEYAPTQKNKQVRDFFENNGFRSSGQEDGAYRFEVSPDEYVNDKQLYFKRIDCSSGDSAASCA